MAINAEISFTGAAGATSYTVFYSFDGGLNYLQATSATSPIGITYDPIADCGKTIEGYIVTNCSYTNAPASSQVKFPNIVIPACPPVGPCNGNYQAILFGVNAGSVTSRKINNLGVYNTADSTAPLVTTGALIYYSALSSSGFYIVGDFSGVNGLASRGIAKLDCDNIKDPSFIVGTGLNANYAGTGFGIGYAIAYDSTRNRVYVGGNFSQYNGVARNNFVVLNASTGAIDPTFTMGSGFQNQTGTAPIVYGIGAVKSIVIQADGKILVGGNFRTYNGVAVNQLVRLNTDGSRDTTFTARVFIGSAPQEPFINDISLDLDNSMFVTGHFLTYDGTNSYFITKILSSGARDVTFNPGINITGSSGSLTGSYGTRVLIQDNNFVLLTGSIKKYGTAFTNGIIRLKKSDGTLDPTYIKDTSTTANIVFKTMKRAPDGNILIGGTAINFQGDNLRKVYYVLQPGNLAIDTTKTVIPGPLDQDLQEILIKYTSHIP